MAKFLKDYYYLCRNYVNSDCQKRCSLMFKSPPKKTSYSPQNTPYAGIKLFYGDYEKI